MDSTIYNPLEDYENRLKSLHLKTTNEFFDKLVVQSGVDFAENRKTVKQYTDCAENKQKIKRKFNLLRFLRVLMCISLVLIPLVVCKTTPQIKTLRNEIANHEKKAQSLRDEALRQMAPLNALFSDKDAVNIIKSIIPSLSFDDCFSVKQENDMRINYDFREDKNQEESTLNLLSGNFNGNPFLYETKLIHRMGEETYHGYKTIYWTETYTDSNGKRCSRTESETLHATVTKPKPFYHTRTVLNYCAQGAPDLSFSRDASQLHTKNEKQIERLVKRGEKKLNKKNDKAVKQNSNFTSMSNTEFEVLFDALDRNNEVQFRTLFTPLAQTNMVNLLLSQTGYGDDFTFVKRRRTNKIISEHSQGRELVLLANNYVSHSFDKIKANFIEKNAEFFKSVYFDFAPLLAIPIYQERPVHSLKPVPDSSQIYSRKECEALANAMEASYAVHPDTKTQAILKSEFIDSKNAEDETCITAFSYDIEQRVDYVSVYGDDGHWHDVPVEWDDYLPLKTQNHFFVAASNSVKNKNVIANRNGLSIFN